MNEKMDPRALSRKIGGLEVSQDMTLNEVLGEGDVELAVETIEETLSASSSLSLDSDRDRRILAARLVHALGLAQLPAPHARRSHRRG